MELIKIFDWWEYTSFFLFGFIFASTLMADWFYAFIGGMVMYFFEIRERDEKQGPLPWSFKMKKKRSSK